MSLRNRVDKYLKKFKKTMGINCNIYCELIDCTRFTVYPDKKKDTVGLTQDYSHYDPKGNEEAGHIIYLATNKWSDDQIIETLGHELAHILIKEKEEELCDWLGKRILKGQIKC